MEQNIIEKPREHLMHQFKEEETPKSKIILKILIIALIVGLGTVTGYFLSSKNNGSKIGFTNNSQMIKTENTIGSTDTRTFRDQAEGKLEKGGIEGEGTHKLIRDTKRPDQNVYLTSSVIDLDQFIGKKIRVWGETNTGQKAGWLMDVGKVETL